MDLEDQRNSFLTVVPGTYCWKDVMRAPYPETKYVLRNYFTSKAFEVSSELLISDSSGGTLSIVAAE